ncbi:oligosaccharide flippase family protein [Pseudomonas ogarae]|uniref:oligosaccharide flippase family protein n=1 Tax=Pseudomonas ogarae (strain DSM 112162 / CECT 30235 / F113) TaxID=1114970 RepID=UPI00023B477B|nr:oligosaccharide flippase family protein [Pseudomonas ogarae]AEV61671.1 MatE [Pseudomonas ogarae]
MRINQNLINGLALVSIQGANALFPLLVFPFLFTVLDKDAFAELVVAEAMAFYVLTVCLYSFDTSGVHSIVEARKQGGASAEAECFFNILGARIVLFIVSALPLASAYYVFTDGGGAVLLVWLCFVLGTILQCNYYFQAAENSIPLAVFVLVSRFCAVLAIYLIVDSVTDILVVSMILAGSFLVSGVAALIFLVFRFGAGSIGLASADGIISLLREGWHLFLGNISVALFRGANILILAGVSNSVAVSAYAVAEKVIKSIQALARPLNQLFMPKAVKAWSLLAVEQKTNLWAFKLIWDNTRFQIYLMLVALPLGVLAIYAGHTQGLLPGFNDEAIMLIILMAPAVIFGVANAMFGVVGLTLIGAQAYFAITVFSIGASVFLFSLVVSCFFGALGAALAFVLAEMLLLIAFICKYKKVVGG